MSALSDELTGDPAGVGYAAMATAGEILVAITARTRPRPRAVIPAHEIVAAIDPGEYPADAAAAKLNRLRTILAPGEVDMRSANVRAILAAIFPAGSATRTALAALQTERVSRLELAGLAEPTLHQIDVAMGRF